MGAHAPEALLAREVTGAERLRAAARLLADEARAANPVRAERLLVALRQAWEELPRVRRGADDDARRALWDRLVLICCEEFYAPAPPAAPGEP